MDSLNVVALVGVIERAPIVRWNENGQPTTSCTLRLEEHGQGGVVYRTYVPCEAYGQQAERLGTANAGDLLSVEGKLKWCTWLLARGEKKSSLAVLVRSASVMVPAQETANA